MSSTTIPSTRSLNYQPILNIESVMKDIDSELIHYCRKSIRNFTVSNDTELADYVGDIHTNENDVTETKEQKLRKTYWKRVVDAYRNRRIFTVFGNYHTIRRAMIQRGWLEKLPPNRFAKLQTLSETTLLEHAAKGNKYETVVISNIINSFPSFFIWQAKGQRDMSVNVQPYRNRVHRSPTFDFSTKVGLVCCSEQVHWFAQAGVCDMSHPRFYRLGCENFDERLFFIDDFQKTQARSLLRFILEHDATSLVDPKNGTVLISEIDYALQRVNDELREKEHITLDETRDRRQNPAELLEMQAFMINSAEILKGNARFKTTERAIKDYVFQADEYLKAIEKQHPDYVWDGCRNLWILKPGFQSCGNGIVIRSSLDEILQWISNNPNRKYIVQKYIERPLLIYKTKFDIRQYMLLTIGEKKISVWLYRDCYLRFSTQEFTMDDLRESIHLTNNSVQRRYKNNENRHPHLPHNNMWSLEQFKSYLRNVNAPDNTWDLIYSGFKQNLIAVVLTSLDETELKKNAFELYGCDFMIDEQYNPILIELNSTPDLTPTTQVTAHICPMALKDVVRVVVDLPNDERTSTGLFECVYELDYSNNRNLADVEPFEIIGTAAVLHTTGTKQPTKGTKQTRSTKKTK